MPDRSVKDHDLKIDFVLTWVDCNDPDWQREKAKYQGKTLTDDDLMRYRDWDNLRYWFRGVEKFAPWVNHVYFVTCGQIPKWMNTDNPKLKLVNHVDYIPEKYLPTFSSRAIDLNFHRIEELSEHFVRFDDDMFLTAPVEKEDFFVKGLPRAVGIADINCVQGAYKDGNPIPVDKMFFTTATDIAVINRNFNKNEVLRRNPGKWFSPKYGGRGIKNLLLLPFRYFSAFELFHIPYPYLKSEFSRVWEREGEVLDQACSHRFRQNTDVNHWLIYYWQLAEGRFAPQSPKIGRSFSISQYAKEDMLRAIVSGTYKMICLNDNYDGDEFERMRDDINGAFERVLGEKSSFEK